MTQENCALTCCPSRPCGDCVKSLALAQASMTHGTGGAGSSIAAYMPPPSATLPRGGGERMMTLKLGSTTLNMPCANSCSWSISWNHGEMTLMTDRA
jgi:hypothetical protein